MGVGKQRMGRRMETRASVFMVLCCCVLSMMLSLTFVDPADARILGPSHINRQLQASPQPPTEAEIDRLVLAALNASNVPSASIAISRNGNLVWSKAYGNAYVEAPAVAASTSTLYQTASVTKTVTAVLVGGLIAQGRLDLDGDISQYLPFKVRNPKHLTVPITARMLMTHTSSINDGSIWADLLSNMGGDPVVTLKDGLREFYTAGGLYNEPMNFGEYAPGSRFEYSNLAVGLVGYVCEAIYGIPFVELATEKVLQPLGMDTSFWYYADAAKMGISLRPQVSMPYGWKSFAKTKKSHKPTSGSSWHLTSYLPCWLTCCCLKAPRVCSHLMDSTDTQRSPQVCFVLRQNR